MSRIKTKAERLNLDGRFVVIEQIPEEPGKWRGEYRLELVNHSFDREPSGPDYCDEAYARSVAIERRKAVKRAGKTGHRFYIAELKKL